MKQYIDKDTLIGEIDRLQESIKATAIDDKISKEQAEAYKIYVKLRSFIEDTLETKEVNLEKEIEEVKHNYKVDDNRHTSICSADIEWLAKHFYELGLKSIK